MQSAYFSTRLYISIFGVLVILTVCTVAASFLPLDGAWHIVIGLSIGLVKASLVALFFMHLAGSPRLTWSIVAIALLWLIVLVVLTFADYATRGCVPGMPGH
jgi:cytochrome c oxidase subunit 4